MTGRMVSHYRIIEKVGEGGMGVVYRAEDTLLERTVALKFISTARLASENSRKHFYREARAAAALEHENICPIHEIAECDDSTFIVMGFCQGYTLRDMISEGPLPLGKAVDVIRDIARGLQCAHEKGVIHRDIKPSNIMIDPERDRAKIMDFGLAKIMRPGSEGTTTTQAGTIAYVSPELIENSKVDTHTDIWSLGVTFYETITGKRPFTGQYNASIIYSILNDEPDMSHVPDTPEGVLAGEIIRKSLRKDPKDRYPDIASLIEDLDRLKRIISGETSERPNRRKRLPWYRVRPLFILIVALLALPLALWFDSLDRSGQPGDEDLLSSAGDSARTEADMMFERGERIYETGDHVTGITLIEEAAEMDPDHMMALKTLATYYNASGESEKAAAYIDRAKKIAMRSGTPLELLKCNIVEAYVWHDWKMAIRYLENLLEEEPADPRVHINIGFIYSRYIGDFERAIEHLDEALRIDPDDRNGLHKVAWNYKASAKLYLGLYDEAIDAIERYRVLAPDSPDPGLTLAVAWQFSGQYEKVIDYTRNAILDDTHSFKYFEVLGISLLSTGRWQEAIEVFNRYIGAADTKGFKAAGHFHLARLYLMQRDRESLDSETASLEATEPGSIRALWLRGVSALIMDDSVEVAQRYLDDMHAVLDRPFVFDGKCYLSHLAGLLQLARGNPDQAIGELEAAESASTRDFYYFGKEVLRAVIEAGDLERAVAIKERLEALNPNDPELLVSLHELYIRRGDMVMAAEYRTRLFELLDEADPGFVILESFISKYGR